MNRLSIPALILSVLLVAAPAAFALDGNPDVGGTWRLNASTLLSGEEVPCEYQGDLPLTQEGDSWNGPADLMLLSGPAACPGEMTGDLTGMLSPSDQVGVTDITGTISGADPEGKASFTGIISVGAPPQVDGAPDRPASAGVEPTADDSLQGGGSLSVDQGLYMGVGGTWSAARLATSVLQIPVLTPLGLTLLVLLILAAGALVLRRRRGAA